MSSQVRRGRVVEPSFWFMATEGLHAIDVTGIFLSVKERELMSLCDMWLNFHIDMCEK